MISMLRRLVTILVVFWRYRLDTFFTPENAPRSVAPWLRLMPWRLLPEPAAPRGERLRASLESLGPIFVKFGQMLSTRHDLLPPDIAAELSKLQDKVPPFRTSRR